MAAETKVIVSRDTPVRLEGAIARLDTQSLIATALEKGSNVETLEKLVALAERMQATMAKEAYVAAMAEFQKRCPSIKKASEARIQSTRGSYSYRYAALDDIMGTVLPILGELGLTATWRTKTAGTHVTANCLISHRQGHTEDSGEVAMPVAAEGASNPAQRVGSALTYAKRYSLIAILGIAPEDDDDAQASHDGRATDQEIRQAVDRMPRAEPSAEALFPQQDEIDERAKLNAEAARLFNKLKWKQDLRQSWIKHTFPGLDLMTCDLAALKDGVDKLKKEAGE